VAESNVSLNRRALGDARQDSNQIEPIEKFEAVHWIDPIHHQP